jgi:hypothetical protein
VNTELVFRLIAIVFIIVLFGISGYFRGRAERQAGALRSREGRARRLGAFGKNTAPTRGPRAASCREFSTDAADGLQAQSDLAIIPAATLRAMATGM